jgi:arylsulfatase A-like enzyme
MKSSPRIQFRPSLWLALLLAFLLPAVRSAAEMPATNRLARPMPPGAPAHPNIILILADDLGYGDLGCYGQQKIQTPNLDHLAAAGTRFTSFYAGSAEGTPARGSLMTGRDTGHATLRGDLAKATLTAQDLTVAQLLRGAGYKNCLIGIWSLGEENSPGLPGDKGFEEFVGYLNPIKAHDYFPRFADRYDTKEGLRLLEFVQNANGNQGMYFPDMFNKSALNFIRINKPDWFNQQRPFFLYYATTLPHANNELGQETGNGMQVPNDKPYSDQPWPQPEKNKAAMITRLDRYVGEIVAKLKEYHQETNTLILFTSDNGPHQEGGVDPEFFQSSGPLRGLKRDLYEGGIRVPLIAVWPGKIPAGRVSDEPWAFWDILPTLAEIGGAKAPHDIEGLSYLPTLLGQTQTNRHDSFYWEFHERGFKQAVREGDWKAVRNTANAPLELYNLKSDPGETKNVAADHPDIIARLAARLKTARTDSPLFPVQETKPAAAK